MVKTVKPTQTIGLIGGGQLGRMIAIAAKQLGFKIAVLDPTENSPAGQVADIEIVADYSDKKAAMQLIDVSDVITYEFENVNAEVCQLIESYGKLPQGSQLIKLSQDRAYEKEAIEKSGAKVVPYRVIFNEEQLKEACFELGFPVVVKTRRGGYDGKGQILLQSEKDLSEAEQLVSEQLCIVEKFLHFEKEISVIVNRGTTGEMTSFPVAENIHVNHILVQSIVPARIEQKVEQHATKLAEALAQSINMVGTLGVEMFLTHEGKIYINEIAPRPHNSGHYTLDACETSQFEQHVRSISGFKLGSPELYRPVIMMNILGEHFDDAIKQIPSIQNAKLHLYGKKDVKTKRKMGHINFLTNDINEALKQIDELQIWREMS
ncbi:5-(carboxyamino)imidazole ribonucleotide synthase [Bacillaceae bacterium W0354]